MSKTKVSRYFTSLQRGQLELQNRARQKERQASNNEQEKESIPEDEYWFLANQLQPSGNNPIYQASFLPSLKDMQLSSKRKLTSEFRIH